MFLNSGIFTASQLLYNTIESAPENLINDKPIYLAPGINSFHVIPFLESISVILIENNLIFLNDNTLKKNEYGNDVLKFFLELYYQNLNQVPFWLKQAKWGRSRLLLHLSENDINDRDFYECLLQAKLLDDELDAKGSKWWGNLKIYSRNLEDGNKSKIGLKGELLSMEYERKRGIKNPIHKSIDNDSLGYDIASYHYPSNTYENNNLFIEVKTSEKNMTKSDAIISKNEWEKAKIINSDYCFHLWNISSNIPKLAKVYFEEMKIHEPKNYNQGEFLNFKVPFLAFNNLFNDVENLIDF